MIKLRTGYINITHTFCVMSCLLHPSPKQNAVFLVGEKASDIDEAVLGATCVKGHLRLCLEFIWQHSFSKVLGFSFNLSSICTHSTEQ